MLLHVNLQPGVTHDEVSRQVKYVHLYSVTIGEKSCLGSRGELGSISMTTLATQPN